MKPRKNMAGFESSLTQDQIDRVEDTLDGLIDVQFDEELTKYKKNKGGSSGSSSGGTKDYSNQYNLLLQVYDPVGAGALLPLPQNATSNEIQRHKASVRRLRMAALSGLNGLLPPGEQFSSFEFRDSSGNELSAAAAASTQNNVVLYGTRTETNQAGDVKQRQVRIGELGSGMLNWIDVASNLHQIVDMDKARAGSRYDPNINYQVGQQPDWNKGYDIDITKKNLQKQKQEYTDRFKKGFADINAVTIEQGTEGDIQTRLAKKLNKLTQLGVVGYTVVTTGQINNFVQLQDEDEKIVKINRENELQVNIARS
jgi:hypothetical protein